jgi:hypothetical protein
MLHKEPCPSCRKPLPPLLPTGERPSTHCQHCGTPLRPPGALLEFCPGCTRLLPELQPDGTRASDRCPACGKTLPPPPGDCSRRSDESLIRPTQSPCSGRGDESPISAPPDATPPSPTPHPEVMPDAVSQPADVEQHSNSTTPTDPPAEIENRKSKIENPSYCPKCVACLLPLYSDSPPYQACPSCGFQLLDQAQPPPLAA